MLDLNLKSEKRHSFNYPIKNSKYKILYSESHDGISFRYLRI